MRAASPAMRMALASLGAAMAATSALALPAPPYMADSQGDAALTPSGPQMLDRYGGGRPSTFVAPTALSGRQGQNQGAFLAWSGKTAPPASVLGAAAGVGPWASNSTTPAQSSPTVPLRSPQGQWRPYTAASVPPVAAPATANQSSGPTNPAQTPYRQAQNNPGGPRFYSLHREYGLQPDAIPLPPQFFGATADLSTPSTDPLAKRTTIVNGQAKTVAVPDDQGPQ